MLKKNKKALLLFEVTVVVFLVSLASLFLFRGYNAFVRAAKQSSLYFQAAALSDKMFFDLQLLQSQAALSQTSEKEGELSGEFKWNLVLEPAVLDDVQVEDLFKARLSIENQKRKQTFDTVIFLKVKE